MSRSSAGVMECSDCGLLVEMPTSVNFDENARCPRCDRVLSRPLRHGVELSLCCSALALMLLVMALGSTLMSLHAASRFSSATLFSGPEMLVRRGRWDLAALVLAILIVAPSLKLLILLVVGVAAKTSRPVKAVRWLFGCLDRTTPWAMVEVFLAGAAVAYSRLVSMAVVELGPALGACVGLAAALGAADAALDRGTVWKRLSPAEPTLPSDRPGTLLACDACALVLRALSGERCPRCGHRLAHRKPNSIARTWATVIAAALLYIPANVIPVMTVFRWGRGGQRTIIGGVMELANKHLWPLAIIVFLASLTVPLLKLAVLVVVLVMTQRGSDKALLARLRMYRFVRTVGRWSMIDVFMLTLLVGMVRMGFIAKVLPNDGAPAFAAVVVLTMIATESMDTRLMWDAAGVGDGRHASTGESVEQAHE